MLFKAFYYTFFFTINLHCKHLNSQSNHFVMAVNSCVLTSPSCVTFDLSSQGDQGTDQSLGNQQTAVINLGVGGFMSPQAAGTTLPHTHTDKHTHTHPYTQIHIESTQRSLKHFSLFSPLTKQTDTMPLTGTNKRRFTNVHYCNDCTLVLCQ